MADDFDPDAYLKAKTARDAAFNPDAYLAAKASGAPHGEAPAPPPAPRPMEAHGVLEAAGRGFGKGALFGFQDEIGGAMGGATAAALRIASKLGLPEDKAQELAYELTGIRQLPGEVGQAGRAGYVQARDELRRDDKAAAEAHPWAHGLAQVGGALAMPIGGKGKALNTVGRLALNGALVGGLSAAGNSEADLVDDAQAQDTGDAGQLLRDTLAGAGTGAVVAPAVAGAAQGGMWALRKLAETNAAKAVAGMGNSLANRARTAGLPTVEAIRDFGRQVLDRGLVKAGDTSEKILNRAEGEYEPALKSVYENINAEAAKRGVRVPVQQWEDATREAITKDLTAAGEREAGAALKNVSLPRRQAEMSAMRAQVQAAPVSFQDQVARAQEALIARGENAYPAAIAKELGLTPQQFTAQLLGAKGPVTPAAPSSVPFADARRLKTDMAAKIEKSWTREPTLAEQLQQRTVGVAKDQIRGALEAADPALAEELAASDKGWAILQKLKKLSGESATRDALKNTAGQAVQKGVESLAAPAAIGMSAAGHGGMGLGVLGAKVLGKALRDRTPATLAVGADALAPLLPRAAPGVTKAGLQSIAEWLDGQSDAKAEAAAKVKALRKKPQVSLDQ